MNGTPSLTEIGMRLLRRRIISRAAAMVAGAPHADLRVVREAAKTIREEQERIFVADASSIVDSPSRGHLIACSALLAAARALTRALADEDKAIGVLEEELHALIRGNERAMMWVRMGISPVHPERAFVQIGRNFRRRGQAAFGKSFEYRDAVATEEKTTVEVVKCYFVSFFRRHGAPKMMRLFCPMDGAYLAEMNEHPERYGTRFERPTTLAAGDDRCRFEFHRV